VSNSRKRKGSLMNVCSAWNMDCDFPSRRHGPMPSWVQPLAPLLEAQKAKTEETQESAPPPLVELVALS
jgi:hypothetical protein